MSERAISVIIPAHIAAVRGLELLGVQLDALTRQSIAQEFEVIVSDNRSKVDLKGYVSSHPARERLRLRYADASAVAGAAFARNVGAEHATGEVLLFCDHDDRVHEDWVARMVEFLGTGYDLICSAVEGDSLNAENPRTVGALPPPDRFQPSSFFAPVIVGCSMACRAEVYRKLGGQDVTYAANEDLEFGWRAHREGYRTGYLAEALVAYRFRTGFRPGYRQGRGRGLALARLDVEYPGSGLPEVRLAEVVVRMLGLLVARGLVPEERGLLFGLAVGQLLGGSRHRTLRLT